MVLSSRAAAVAATVGLTAVFAGVLTPGWLSMEYSYCDSIKGTEDMIQKIQERKLDRERFSNISSNIKISPMLHDFILYDIKVSIFYIRFCTPRKASPIFANCVVFHYYRTWDIIGQSHSKELNSCHWHWRKIEACLAMVLGLLGLICSYIPLSFSCKIKIMQAILVSVLLGIASIVSFALVGRVAKINVDVDHVDFPYSLVLAGGGAACLLAASVSAMISACMMRNDQGGQVLSAVEAGGGVHLANIVPGIKNTSQGYAVLLESNLTIKT